tara:strand:- start:1402 stop:2034 length:633 start_codon:yes stop_codon:yes gene_type:complete
MISSKDKNGSTTVGGTQTTFPGTWEETHKDQRIQILFSWKDIPDKGSCDNYFETYDDANRLVRWETQDSMGHIEGMAQAVLKRLKSFDPSREHVGDGKTQFGEFLDDSEVLEFFECTYTDPNRHGNLLDIDASHGDRIDLGRYVHLIKLVQQTYKTLFKTLSKEQRSKLYELFELNVHEAKHIIYDAKKIAMDWWRSLHTQDLKDWVEVK